MNILSNTPSNWNLSESAYSSYILKGKTGILLSGKTVGRRSPAFFLAGFFDNSPYDPHIKLEAGRKKVDFYWDYHYFFDTVFK